MRDACEGDAVPYGGMDLRDWHERDRRVGQGQGSIGVGAWAGTRGKGQKGKGHWQGPEHWHNGQRARAAGAAACMGGCLQPVGNLKVSPRDRSDES